MKKAFVRGFLLSAIVVLTSIVQGFFNNSLYKIFIDIIGLNLAFNIIDKQKGEMKNDY